MKVIGNLACIFILFSGLLLITSCNNHKYEEVKEKKEEKAAMTLADSIKRGEYLIASIGCTDCHTPKRMGERGPEDMPDMFLAGHPADAKISQMNMDAIKKGWSMFSPNFTATVGPWGISYAANLTPDDTGLGSWTKEQFITAIREGKYKGQKSGRDLLPPMPWFNFAKLTDEDLESMFKYLQTIPAVNNAVPPPTTPDQLKNLPKA
ncbi:diheme cytochrome c-553 [Christiangramia fulva]|uniref:Diheme cytochrome c-553 n=2 Tax=Christiangramia fulva TaxID=2126553 RepID=A0A2R3Z266_9FLAO|nr:diheme cytochrome c-553 [Christiangramia fulva]